MKTRILVTDGISKEGIDLLKTHPHFELEIRTSTSKDELLAVVNSYDVLISRSMTVINAEVIEKGQPKHLPIGKNYRDELLVMIDQHKL